jgi:DNA adenine methylase
MNRDTKIKIFLNSLRTNNEEPIYNVEKRKSLFNNKVTKVCPKKRDINRYSRVSLSPLRYAGGKSLGIGELLELYPPNEDIVVSPFFGGGSFEIVLSKLFDVKVYGYDIFDILVKYWKIQISNPILLYNELTKLIPDKENFDKNKDILLYYFMEMYKSKLNYNPTYKTILTNEEKNLLFNNDLLIATYYFYNHCLSYGPMFLGCPSGVYLTNQRYNTSISKVKNFDDKNLEVNNLSFDKVLEKYNDVYLFLDPPYYLGGDSKVDKGIYPNSSFPIFHNNFDHKLLCEMLNEHKGKFMMTYNNCEEIRKLYKDYKQLFPTWQYSFGIGETRIGDKRKSTNTNTKLSSEIIIIKE